MVLALEKKYGQDIEFVIVNPSAEEGNSLAQKYNIRYIPAFIILDRRGEVLFNIDYSEISAGPQAKLEGYILQAINRK